MAGDIDLTVPNLTTPGPQYAQQISDDLDTISTHNHDGVSAGAQIDLSVQLCNNDLSIVSHNLTNVRSVELNDNPSKLTGTQDVNCLYINQNVLGFNDSDGNFIPIANGGGVIVTNQAFTNWSQRPGVVTANFSVLAVDPYNLVHINSAGGAITGTLPICANIVSPGASSSPVGRLYLFKDVSGHAGTHPITIQVAPASGNTFGNASFTTSIVINNNFGYVAIYTDGIDTWFVWSSDVLNEEVFALNTSLLQIKQSSQIVVDASSAIVNSAGTYSQTGGTFGLAGGVAASLASSTLAVSGTSAVTWSGSANETFGSGTSETFAAGSTLTCNGTLAGTTTGGTFTIASTCTVSGTLNLPGATNLNGTGTISGSGYSLTGALSVTGGVVVCAASAAILLDDSCQLTNHGHTILFAEEPNTAIVAAGATYTCDTSTILDNQIGLVTGTSGGTVVVLPVNPVQGRKIRLFSIGNAVGTTYTIDGNGQTILGNATYPLVFQSYSSSSITSFAIELLFVTGHGWAVPAALNITV